jgi:hypothetical protein
LHIIGNSTVTVTKMTKNATVNLDVASTSVTVGYADATGTSDVVTVNLGTGTAVNYGTLVLADANAVGIGTVNLVSNGTNITAGSATPNTNTMVLTDNGLSNLNFSGTQGLTFTTLNQATTQATSLTINNTNTSAFGLVATALVDANLGALNFAGTGHSTITLLTDASSTLLGITNTGSQTALITGIATTGNMTSLTLTGNTQIGTGLVGSATGVLLSNTGGITISGATDHAPVRAIITGAIAGNTDSITLGNGNNSITDTSSATTATVNITVGTGSNAIFVGNGVQAADSVFNITLGTHTAASGYDFIALNNTGGANYLTAVNNTVAGAVTGDVISWGTADAGCPATGTLTATAAVAAAISEAAAITALIAAVNAAGAHGVAYGVYGGNTYVAEESAAAAGNTITMVKIIGIHTLSATVNGGYDGTDIITLLS